MNEKEIKSALFTMEEESYPCWAKGIITGSASREINGHKVQAKSKCNRGKSGKGFTTSYYVDGNRVAKAKLVDILSN